MTRVIGIVSLKGGVGKTSCVTNLASALKEHDQKVLVVDANLSAPNLGIHLGLIDPKNTLHDVLRGEAKINEAVHKYDKFDFIPASLYSGKVNALELKNHINQIKKKYDIVLIDSTPALNSETLAVMLASDELLLVTTPEYPALSATMRMAKQAEKQNTKVTGILVNKSLGKNYELKISDIEDATGLHVLGLLPYDENVLHSISLSTPLVDFKPNSKIAHAFKEIAASLFGKEYKRETFSDKIKKFFQKKKDVRKDKVNRLLLKHKKL